MTSLPGDLILLICEQIANQQDFNTLFNCAVAGKQLAGSALLCLYTIHNRCNFITNTEVADLSNLQPHLNWQERVDRGTERATYWALLWKSIIRSSLGTTAYPYCLYIQSLDLRNLEDLLDDSVFLEKVSGSFFAGEMVKFSIVSGTPIKMKTRLAKGSKQPYAQLDTTRILDLVGESITNFVSEAAIRNKSSVALEDIAGNISAAALSKWSARLSRLKSLTVYDGAALSEDVARAIADKCPNFDDLTFRHCTGDNADRKLASFFNSLRHDSLQSFEAINASSIGPETLLGLNHHSSSLKVLKLQGLKFDVILRFPLLQGCNNLEVLELHGISQSEGLINLEAIENDVFLEIVALFRQFKQLRELSLKNFAGAPQILTHMCLLDNIRLRKLFVSGYNLPNQQLFHQAIPHQTALENLTLRADPEDAFRDDIDALVNSICALPNLRYLNLRDTSDYCSTAEISQLASKLLTLEEFSFTGYDVTDAIWPAMSGLHHLTTLDIYAMSRFTTNRILDYISTLKETNRGLVLSAENQLIECDISDQEQAIIKEAIAAKVDGKFELQLYRDEDDIFDSTSD